MKKPLLLGALLLTVACSGADEVDVSSEELSLGQFSGRFGASGDVVDSASLEIYGDLYARGVKKVREVTYLSYGRGPLVSAAVLNLVAQHVDVFVSVFVSECGDSVATGCHDLWDGTATNASDKPNIKNAFKAHFQTVVDASNPVVNGARQINVKEWGVNEPDGAMGGLEDWPERAALFYLGAREVLNESGCTSCTLVAGEFSKFDTNAMPGYFKRYVDELHDDGQFPTVFSLHPYGDVNAVNPGNWKTIHAYETNAYEAAVKAVAPTAQIWLTEVGRMIFRSSVSHTPAEEWASGAYVRHRLAFHPAVTRVYWYQMAASSKGWDTALADAEGRRRASFFGLLGYDETTSLKKASADGSKAAPDQ